MAVGDDYGAGASFGFSCFVSLTFFALLLAGLAVVVVDAVLRFVGFSRFADTAVVEHLFLCGLLGEIVLRNGGAELLYALLAGRQRSFGEVVL